MITPDFGEMSSELKKQFPSVERDIDNLISLLYEDIMDGTSTSEAMDSFEYDLKDTLKRRGISFNPSQLTEILK